MSTVFKSPLKRILKKLDKKFPGIKFFLLERGIPWNGNSIKKNITGMNNTFTYHNATLNAVTIHITGSNNTIEIKDHCVLNNVTFYIKGDNHRILIQESCKFRNGGSIWFEDSGGSLLVGKKSTFESVSLAIVEPKSTITIGEDCMFAYDIELRTSDSHSLIDANSGERINYAKDIHIGNHVWVGGKALILKGVKVADNSVIAAGSIVTKQFEQAGIVIGGNPARQIKTGVDWSRKRIDKVD